MNSTREELLFGLARMKPAAERRAFLDRECASDSSLRRRVEALLAAHEQASGFLPTDMGADTVLDPNRLDVPAHSPDEKEGSLIGRYKLLEKLGEGGFGAVWLAEQKEPVRRKVALEIIKLGMDTKQVVARFRGRAAGAGDDGSPHIAKVLDAASKDTGRPYFVIELVCGISITKYCDENDLLTGGRLALFMQVCHAIQHAHQKGIIHRDRLKQLRSPRTVRLSRRLPTRDMRRSNV